MGESPRWHDGRFWMCDWMAGEVLVFDASGNRDVVARVKGLPFSIDWLSDGRLVATTPTGLMAGPELEPYGASGQPFNEIVVDAAGRAWVDRPGSMPWEERKPGIVSVVLPDGSSRQVADDVWFPNGMVVLGEDTLVLAESHADRLTAWTITDAGERLRRCRTGAPGRCATRRKTLSKPLSDRVPHTPPTPAASRRTVTGTRQHRVRVHPRASAVLWRNREGKFAAGKDSHSP